MLDGRVVRLLRGNYDAETIYDDDPVAVARASRTAAASWIHVVDLDAARDGGDANLGSDRSDLRKRAGARAERRGVRSIEDASERFARACTAS
jgi:phosphoribosylformimino-5-aminoimidazole carboxamide ribotide isomerase